jgi:hypothetical protein
MTCIIPVSWMEISFRISLQPKISMHALHVSYGSPNLLRDWLLIQFPLGLSLLCNMAAPHTKKVHPRHIIVLADVKKQDKTLILSLDTLYCSIVTLHLHFFGTK